MHTYTHSSDLVR